MRGRQMSNAIGFGRAEFVVFAVLDPIDGVVKSQAALDIDEQVDLSPSVSVAQDFSLLNLFVLGIHEQVSHKLTKSLLRITAQCIAAFRGNMLVYPGMGVFMSTRRLEFGTRQAAHDANGVRDFVVIRAELGIA